MKVIRGLHVLRFAVLSVAIIHIIQSQSFAQGYGRFMPYSTVGAGLGTASYYGDMAPYRRVIASTFRSMRFNISGEYTRHFSPRFAGRVSLTWARLAGDDYTQNKSGSAANHNFFIRNLHFRNDVKELALTGILNLVPDQPKSRFNAYFFGGIAFFAHNPKARLPVDETAIEKQKWVALRPLGTEGQGHEGYDKPYSLVKFAIPLGFGISYKINDRFKIGGEVGMRFTTSDYLDDVSKNYPASAVFLSDNAAENGQIAQTMSNRSLERYEARRAQGDRTDILRKYLNLDANTDPIEYLRANPNVLGVRGDSPKKNDSYLLGTIKVAYILPYTVKCPPLK
ncbi:hypothetical protein [Ravibacter arvi]